MPLNVARLGFYEILSPIGSGGMSEVYKARDTRLNRVVALKILPPDFADDGDRKHRFIQEARAASALSSPYVAHIYEVGEEEGLHYIAMEHVEGKGLNYWTENGNLPIAEIQEIAIQITEALQEAHSRGITHRDIKPLNIMLTSGNRVKVLDFGLAKISTDPEMISSEADTLAQTQPGIVMGTVHYLSPEQALGKEVDSRTDIFSLGVVLYQMVAGRLPFAGAAVTEVLDRIIHDTPEALSRFNYNVTPDLDRIIRKCMEKDRDRRYQSAQDLLIDLKNLKRDTESGKVKPVPRAVPLRAAVVALVLVAGIFAAYLIATRIIPRSISVDSLAILPFQPAEKGEDVEILSDGFTEGLIRDFSRYQKLKVMARATVFSYKGKPLDPLKIGLDLKVESVLSGTFSHSGDKLTIDVELVDTTDGARMWAQTYEARTSDFLSIQQEVVRNVSSQLGLKSSEKPVNRTSNPKAYQAYLKARYYWSQRNPDAFEKAIKFFNEAIHEDPEYAGAYSGLADTYAVMVGFDLLSADEGLPRIRTAALKAIELDDSLAEAHVSLAALREFEWKFAEQEREFQRAIELDPNNVTARQWYAEHLLYKGRMSEAQHEIRAALELDPLSLPVNNVACAMMYFTREYDDAIQQCSKEMIVDRNRNRLGQIYAQKKMFKESIAQYQIALQRHPDGVRLLAENFATHGYDTAVRVMREKALAFYQNEAKEYGFDESLLFAAYYALLDNPDSTFYWLDQAFEKHSPNLPASMTDLRFDPEMRSVRADPRFADLLKRMGLPPPSPMVDIQH